MKNDVEKIANQMIKDLLEGKNTNIDDSDRVATMISETTAGFTMSRWDENKTKPGKTHFQSRVPPKGRYNYKVTVEISYEEFKE